MGFWDHTGEGVYLRASNYPMFCLKNDHFLKSEIVAGWVMASTGIAKKTLPCPYRAFFQRYRPVAQQPQPTRKFRNAHENLPVRRETCSPHTIWGRNGTSECLPVVAVGKSQNVKESVLSATRSFLASRTAEIKTVDTNALGAATVRVCLFPSKSIRLSSPPSVPIAAGRQHLSRFPPFRTLKVAPDSHRVRAQTAPG